MGADGKMKVCHLISGDLWAGAEVQAFSLLKALNSVPDLSLWTIVLNEGALAARLRESGVDTFVIDESAHGFFRILDSAKKFLVDKNLDIIHSHRYKENALASLLKRAGFARRIVQTVHGLGEPFSGRKLLKARIYSNLNVYLMKRYFDLVQTVSYDIGKTLARRVNHGKLVAIHNSVDLTMVLPTRAGAELRREIGIAENEPVIGSAGRLVPVKGYDVFLKAARRVLDSGIDASFVLAGDGPERSKLEGLARNLALGAKAKFLGFRNDMYDVINVMDIFVISSFHEGIPMALLEAMALRKPIVATSVGGITEVVEGDVSGVLVPPGDDDKLAAACVRVLAEVELKGSLSTAARKRVEDEFSIALQRDRTLAMYRELMSRT